MLKKIVAAGLMLLLLGGCGRNEELIVYAGNGLNRAMDELAKEYEKREGVHINLVYSGSETLLTTLKTTRRGDVFIPGSPLREAAELVSSEQYVATHVPVFAVRSDSPLHLRAYSDLLAPGVRIAVGNKDMNAIGKLVEAILKDADPSLSFRDNIAITASTVNELLQMVADGQVDAAVVWSDMLNWESAKGLVAIEIPPAINKSKEIWVCTLTTSAVPARARHFADYVAGEGRGYFVKHGFTKNR